MVILIILINNRNNKNIVIFVIIIIIVIQQHQLEHVNRLSLATVARQGVNQVGEMHYEREGCLGVLQSSVLTSWISPCLVSLRSYLSEKENNQQ